MTDARFAGGTYVYAALRRASGEGSEKGISKIWKKHEGA